MAHIGSTANAKDPEPMSMRMARIRRRALASW
jgi:hypothetical protein